MFKHRRGLIFLGLAVALLVLPWAMGQGYAGDGGAAGRATLAVGDTVSNQFTFYANSPQPDPNNGQGAIPLVSGTPIRKFVDSLPGLTAAGVNNLGQYIPVATPAANPLYPGSDYYEIGLKQYRKQLHSDLPAAGTLLRGYYQINGTDHTSQYLGPLVVAGRNRPVRVLFKNQLSTGIAGDLFVPVDSTIMGAGMGPDGMHSYTQNRADLHLHGGFTPWISDGTAHQWITPPLEAGPFFRKQENPYYNFKGVSFQNVPDMVGTGKSIPAPAANDGLATYYYPNAQSSRLMFYHDHAYGITRLNVYAGEAAGYLLTDSTENTLATVMPGTIPVNLTTNAPDLGTADLAHLVPLIIQDKTFVPADIDTQDSSWNTWRGANGIAGAVQGDLWFPHKYEPNQDPSAVIGGIATGNSLFGRWDYGPWFWPPTPTTTAPGPGPVGTTHLLPGEATDFSNPWVYNTSIVPEAFMDTMLVNGTAYPYLSVNPTAYRVRLLNACNDRNLNLSMFVADTGGTDYSVPGNQATATAAVPVGGVVPSVALGSGGVGYTSAPSVYITGGGGTGAAATVALGPSAIASITPTNGGTGYTTATVTLTGGGLTGGTATTATATVTGGSVTGFTLTAGTGTYTDAPLVSITGDGFGATAMAALTAGPLATITLTSGGSGYTSAPTVQIGGATEVKMVPALGDANGNPLPGYPSTWPTDGRAGGVPDPATRGPNIIQIGNEAGLLAAPALIPSQPVTYEYNRRNIVVLNVLDKALFAGPAERADFIVDFSQFAGKTIILYNDAPAPVPAFDPRYDYYTGNPDQRAAGGAATTLPGFGPNTRTVMQFRVAPTGATAAYNLAALQAALPAAFAAAQPPPIVPLGTYARIQDFSLNFADPNNYFPGVPVVSGKKTIPLQPKAIQELFDDFGRMNATLGVELPVTNIITQTTLPFQYIDPPTEGGDPKKFPGAVPIKNNDTQIWKITHNGVDTHTIHFHLVNVQVVNRVGWDGSIRPPDPNEIGWKESVRMHPLEDCIVAAKFALPVGANVPPNTVKPLGGLPFTVPQSSRMLDPTSPKNSSAQFSAFDATGNPINITNQMTSFGWEYVWHCHLLGHEENDMMRAIVVNP
jgi:FtsP/CotA-like multicopper oxidase with cupredoxin domain